MDSDAGKRHVRFEVIDKCAESGDVGNYLEGIDTLCKPEGFELLTEISPRLVKFIQNFGEGGQAHGIGGELMKPDRLRRAAS